MFPLTEAEKRELGPSIAPFGRSQKPADQKVMLPGEDHKDEFVAFIHDAIGNHRPTIQQRYIELSNEQAELLRTNGKSTPAHYDACFLWIIDEVSIKMIREATRNERAYRRIVCHTNLTDGGVAFLGGEVYFCEDGSIYISQKSDRYGWAEAKQWETALNYFRRVFAGCEFVVLSP